jgi:hypothetical protein
MPNIKLTRLHLEISNLLQVIAEQYNKEVGFAVNVVGPPEHLARLDEDFAPAIQEIKGLRANYPPQRTPEEDARLWMKSQGRSKLRGRPMPR